MKNTLLLSTALCASFAFCGQTASAQTILEEAPAPPEPIEPTQTIGSQFSADADAQIIVEEGTLVVPTPFFPGFDFGVYIDGAASAAVLEQGAQIIADTPFGFGMVSTASGGTLTISGDIITSGFQGGGVFVAGPTANTVNVAETGVVFTSGNGFQSAGIQAQGAGDTVNIDGRVQSQGVEASGVLVGFADSINVNVGASGQVLSEGDFAPGLSTFLDPRNFNISFANTGLVQTFGNAAPGIVLATQGASATNDGTIATMGDGSPGVLLVQGKVRLINNGTIAAHGGTFDANIEELVGLASPGSGVTPTTVPSAGVFIGNGEIEVTNSGSITSATGPAIVTSAQYAAVTNASGFGIGDPAQPVIISNTTSGSIRGGTLAIQGSALIEQITNAGAIVGDVLLDEGDDGFTLALATGSVDGMIDGGAGADALVLSGSGAFEGSTQTGFESLTLNGTGSQTLSGDFGSFETILAQGGIDVLLEDNAVLASTAGAQFKAGSILGGTGTITGAVTSAGIIDPGGSGATTPGTLTIGGDFTLLEDGMLRIGIAGSSVDSLTVGGSADILGSLAIAPVADLNFGMLPASSTIISAGSGVTVADLSPQTLSSGVLTLVATPVIEGNNLEIQFAVTSDFAGLSGLDANALAVAGALDRGFASADAASDFRVAAGELRNSVDERTLDILSPEFYDSVIRASVLAADRAMDHAFLRISTLPYNREPGLWAAIGYEGFERDGSDVFQYEIDQFDAALGVDFALGPIIAGIAAVYSSSDFGVVTSPTSDAGEVETFGILAYGSTANPTGLNVDAAFAYQSADADTVRSTVLSGIEGRFTADTGSEIVSAEARTSYLQPIGPNLLFKGWLGLDFVSVGSDSFVESGTGAFALSIDSQSYEEFGGTAGLDLIGNFGSETAPVRPYIGGFIRRVFGGEGPLFSSSFLSAPSSNFVVEGDFDRTQYGINAGIFTTIMNGAGSLGLDYRGTFSDNNNAQRGSLTLVFPF